MQQYIHYMKALISLSIWNLVNICIFEQNLISQSLLSELWLWIQWNRHRENLWHMVASGVHVSLLQKPWIRLHSPSLSHPRTHPLHDNRHLVSILEMDIRTHPSVFIVLQNHKLKSSALQLSVIMVLDWHCLIHWHGLKFFKKYINS